MDVLLSSRKKYTPEHRFKADRLVAETGRPIAHVAPCLGVGVQRLNRRV